MDIATHVCSLLNINNKIRMYKVYTELDGIPNNEVYFKDYQTALKYFDKYNEVKKSNTFVVSKYEKLIMEEIFCFDN
jgi:hypothetical protein